jgi:hypothetical protein
MASVIGVPQLQHRLQAIGSAQGLPKQLGLMTVREAKLLVHRKTGMTGRSIHVASTTPRSVTVSAGYGAVFLEHGTRPHIITPNVARVLAWGGGRRLTGSLRSGAKPEFFAMLVHHPGSRPYPFLVPGAKIAVQKTGVDAIVQLWNRAA